MKSWIKRSLFTLGAATLVIGGLSACGTRGDHSHSWSDGRVTEMRTKAIEKISGKLDLNAEQKVKLGTLADEMIASRKAFRGNAPDMRTEMQALISADKFDRSKAQQLFDQKSGVIQGSAPKVISAFGDFYDSLNAEQQKQVRERISNRGGGWWSRG
jgi:periplasmic protein CpxP/Spy